MSIEFRVVDGCPAPASIAPYIHIVTHRAGQVCASIYRGADADAILHAHGKHDQAEIHVMYPAISNPAGRSTHELRSDGVAFAGPVGRHLEEWQVGVDSGGDDQASKDAIVAAAAYYGWKVFHPYARGVEGHHWCFREQPHPNNHFSAHHISVIRAALPRR